MPMLYGKHYSREALLKRVGNIHQIGGIQACELTEGRARGTSAIRINTGALSLTLLPSRCLDIAEASYNGIPFGYMSKSGVRNPAYFVENEGKGFLDNFFGGLLTTSGLNNIGAPSEDNGVHYGTHGEMTNVPADSISMEEAWEDDDLCFTVRAVMHHSRFYGEDVQLTRVIRTKLGASSITLHDTIENLDFKPFPLFFLYHINFGFPLVDEQTRIIADGITSIEPRTEHAKAGIATALTCQPPTDGLDEECFYLGFDRKDVKVTLENPSLNGSGLRAFLRYNADQLPEFTEWKMMRSREYVLGFAPGTNRLEGRAHALANERVRWLQPLEKAEFEIELGIDV